MRKYEMHLHTAECDTHAHVAARKIVQIYKELGYDGLVITDHYFSMFYEWFADELEGADHKACIERWLRGYREARDEGERLGLTVLLGAEVRFDNNINDYLIYGLDEDFLLNSPPLNRLLGLSELITVLPEDACVVQAHPFRDKMTIRGPAPLFGIEVENGGTEPFRNEMARIFAEHYGKRMLSGSDLHRIEQAGRGGIMTEKTIKTQGDLISVLKSGDYSLICRKD